MSYHRDMEAQTRQQALNEVSLMTRIKNLELLNQETRQMADNALKAGNAVTAVDLSLQYLTREKLINKLYDERLQTITIVENSEVQF